MDVEISLPGAPVTLAPGAAVRVPAQLRNPYAHQIDIRLYIARGRAAGWATVKPPALTLAPGETATVHVLLQTPAHQPPSSSLTPFSLHAEDAATGEPAGFATALLTVAVPAPVTGVLTARPTGRHVYDLLLRNETAESAPVLIKARIDPPQAGDAQVSPAEASLTANSSAAVQINAKPKRQLVGTPKKYAILVSVHDALDPGREPYVSESLTGTRNPRMSTRTATMVAVLLALAATAAIAFSGVRLPLPRRKTLGPLAPVATASAFYGERAV